MSRGDHIFCDRGVYQHHGIDLGDGTVIHYTGEVGRKDNAAVCITPIDEFAQGDRIEVVQYAACSPAHVVVQRALSRHGERRYDLVFNNCEHFARWCKLGKARSKQVETRSGQAGTTGLGVAAPVGGVAIVSATGAVAGLSGSGVMSGLAAVGGVVGGGAVAGLGVIGGAPAAAGALLLNNTVFADDEGAPESERSALKAGRVGSCVGGVAGTAGAIATVSASGAVAGLSGAGIASGLAAIGSVAGGGMVAGVAVVAAAPVAIAAAVGGLFYGISKLFD